MSGWTRLGGTANLAFYSTHFRRSRGRRKHEHLFGSERLQSDAAGHVDDPASGWLATEIL